MILRTGEDFTQTNADKESCSPRHFVVSCRWLVVRYYAVVAQLVEHVIGRA